MTSLRVVFMGSPDFAVPSLHALAELYSVVGVVCQPDKPAGRGKQLTPCAVKVAALALNPPGAGSIADAWRAVSAGHEALSALPLPLIEAFLLERSRSPRRDASLHLIARPR